MSAISQISISRPVLAWVMSVLGNTAFVQETAQLSYNIIQYRYKNGVSPRLELTDAELALSTAQSNYLEAVYDYLSARIELRRLTGVP
jgi:outer membrane protein TolC